MRRANEVQRRRDALHTKREQASRSLPDWAVKPLKLVGMTASEIDAILCEQMSAENDAGIEEIDAEIERVEGELDRIEAQILDSSDAGLDGARAMLRLALARMRETTVTDTDSVFYDYGAARMLTLVERAADEIEGVLALGQRKAG